jgi:hypothetical protein
VEVASCLGLSLASTLGVLTHFPFNRALNSSTIDLIFSLDNLPSPIVSILPEEHLFSDHTPMMADLPLSSPEQAMGCKTLPKDSDEEATFLHNVCEGFRELAPMVQCLSVHQIRREELGYLFRKSGSSKNSHEYAMV